MCSRCGELIKPSPFARPTKGTAGYWYIGLRFGTPISVQILTLTIPLLALNLHLLPSPVLDLTTSTLSSDTGDCGRVDMAAARVSTPNGFALDDAPTPEPHDSGMNGGARSEEDEDLFGSDDGVDKNT